MLLFCLFCLDIQALPILVGVQLMAVLLGQCIECYNVWTFKFNMRIIMWVYVGTVCPDLRNLHTKIYKPPAVM